MPSDSSIPPICEDAIKLMAARNVIAKLYVALHREGWEPGPTTDEACLAAQDWLYSQYGNEIGAASEVFWKDLGLQAP